MSVEASIPERDEILERVCKVVHAVTGVPREKIMEGSSFREDLHLDSLAMLEVGVDVDYDFQLGIADLEDRIEELITVGRVVDLVEATLRERAT